MCSMLKINKIQKIVKKKIAIILNHYHVQKKKKKKNDCYMGFTWCSSPPQNGEHFLSA